jgi:hypothetical protein
MSQIVLDDNLKFLISGLSLEHRGELFTSLLEKSLTTTNQEIIGVYQYIMSLQKDIEAKKQRMREIGAKGGRTKKLNQNDATNIPNDATILSSTALASQSTAKSKRKEAKENNIYNKKIKTFINDMLYPATSVEKIFTPPSLTELKSFIETEKLSISAETFIDFYNARNWCMGNIKISDWQAVARMWHRRQQENSKSIKNGTNQITSSDEQYWQALQQRVNSPPLSDEESNQQLPPFKRFIQRVEQETNLLKETDNDTSN